MHLRLGEVGCLYHQLVHSCICFLYILLVWEELANHFPELAAVLSRAEIECSCCDPQILAEDFVFHRVKRTWVYYDSLEHITRDAALLGNELRLLSGLSELL